MNLRRSLALGLLFCFILLLNLGNGYSHTSAKSDDDDDDPETSEIIVKLDPAASANINAIHEEYGTTTIEVLLNSANIYRLRVPENSVADDLAETIADDPRVLYAEPNFASEAPEGNPRHISTWGGPVDSGASDQYAVEMLGLLEAHALRRGQGVTVAILDTGFQMDHPELAASWTSPRYDFIDDDTDPTDVADGSDSDGDGFFDEAFGHGTHIAGIVRLVAPDAQIMPLRVLNSDGHGNIFVISEAVQYAIANGADVINLSLGSLDESDLVEDVLEDAVALQNVVVVAAAGNLSSSVEQFPASEDDVLAVTSIDAESQKSTFASFGEWIDVAAPGEAILSTFPVSDYAHWSGTSMAVPFVSGQAALIRSAVPSLSASEVAAYIRSSAQPIDAQNPGFQEQLGHGQINIGGSMQAICSGEGTCQAPDLEGQLVLEWRAYVESRPSSGLSGTWVIGGDTYVTDDETEFDQEDGPLRIGTCVDVEYRNTSPFTALEIRSRTQDKCQEITTPTPVSTANPTLMPTATPTQTPPIISTTTPQKTVEPTVTPGGIATTNPVTTPTSLPRITSTPRATPTPGSTPSSVATTTNHFLPLIMR